MAAEEIHVGDIGTVLRVQVLERSRVIDLSTMTDYKLRFEKPDESTIEKPAVFTTNGQDGKIQYTTVENDLDMAGEWKIQAILTDTSGMWHSEIARFQVYENILEPN